MENPLPSFPNKGKEGGGKGFREGGGKEGKGERGERGVNNDKNVRKIVLVRKKRFSRKRPIMEQSIGLFRVWFGLIRGGALHCFCFVKKKKNWNAGILNKI